MHLPERIKQCVDAFKMFSHSIDEKNYGEIQSFLVSLYSPLVSIRKKRRAPIAVCKGAL